jgi:hypothetical protein
MWILSDRDAYMSKCNWSVLLSGFIHVFMHFLCWVYSHSLVAGWAPTPLWCRFAGRRSLVAAGLWGWLWSLLVFRSLYWVKLWSVTLGIVDLFYFRLGFRILLNSVLMWNYKCEYFFLYFENYSVATFKI